jgi:hypothetical protein
MHPILLVEPDVFHAPAIVQVIIALVVTPEGLPLACRCC